MRVGKVSQVYEHQGKLDEETERSPRSFEQGDMGEMGLISIGQRRLLPKPLGLANWGEWILEDVRVGKKGVPWDVSMRGGVTTLTARGREKRIWETQNIKWDAKGGECNRELGSQA